jgi:hypothetical protein
MQGEEFVAELRIGIDGADSVAVLEELYLWLGQELELRGLVRPGAAVPGAGQLGAVTDVLIATLGAGGTVSVLAASLRTFLAQPRRSDVHLSVQGPDGKRIEIDAKRATPAEVEELLRRALGQPE